jgi:hypothetical protein
MSARFRVVVVGGVLACLAGCGHVVPEGARAARGDERRAISQAELQQDVQRFTGVFIDRITEAAEPLVNAAHAEQAEEALRRQLIYQASALDIATGPGPEVNFLDMIAFVTLARQSYEAYWLPKVFGASGEPLLQALVRSEGELWQLAERVLSKPQERKLRELIDAFREENPELVRVEAVRLTDFAKLSGASHAEKESRGLLASVKAATKTADHALLFGERSLFLAQRLPFLLRLQVRLGAYEVLSDGKMQLSDADALMRQGDALLARAEALVKEVEGAEHVIGESERLLTDVKATLQTAHGLIDSLAPMTATLEPLLRSRDDVSAVTGIEQLLVRSERLVDSTRLLLQEAQAVTSSHPQALEQLKAELDRTVVRWLVYLGLLGTFLTVVFWTGFYLVKRTSG